MTPIERAVKAAGTQAALARAIQRSPAEINQWVHRRRPVSATACRAIEQSFPGVVTAAELRPDVFGPPQRTAGEAI